MWNVRRKGEGKGRGRRRDMPCHAISWHGMSRDTACMHAYFTNSKVNCFLPPFETIPPQSIFSIMGIADLMCSNNAAGNHCKGKRQQQILKATWNVIWLMIDIKQQWWAPTEWICSPYNPELFFRRKKKTSNQILIILSLLRTKPGNG